MGRRLARCLAAVCVGAVLAQRALAAPADEWKLETEGFGPLKVGMTFAQAQTVVPGLMSTPTDLRASPNCDQLPLPGHPGVALMFVGEVLGRVDIFESGVRTTRGLAPGDPVSSFEQAYPDARRTPKAYDDREVYLTVGPQRGRALRAETREGKVSAIYAGNWTQVQYIEGCL